MEDIKIEELNTNELNNGDISEYIGIFCGINCVNAGQFCGWNC